MQHAQPIAATEIEPSLDVYKAEAREKIARTRARGLPDLNGSRNRDEELVLLLAIEQRRSDRADREFARNEAAHMAARVAADRSIGRVA